MYTVSSVNTLQVPRPKIDRGICDTSQNREKCLVDQGDQNEDGTYLVDREDGFATFKCGGSTKKIQLAKIRMALVVSNFVVLAAAGLSYFAWLDAKYNWQIRNIAQPDRDILRALEHLPPLPDGVERTISGVHCYLDQMLYLTAFNLFLYWAIYGVFISCRFGGPCDICTIVVSLPHTVMMVVWEVGVSVAIIRVNMILTNLPWNRLKFAMDKHYNDLKYVKDFYESWGPWISSFYLLSVPVQMFLVALPFLVSNLPFQGDLERQYGANIKMTSEVKRGSLAMELMRRHLTTVQTFFRERMKFLRTRESNQRNDISIGKCDISDESEYVGLEDVHQQKHGEQEEVSSLYHCEMPHQKMEKFQTQKLFSRVRRVSWRGQSAGRAVLDTMNRVYHVHTSSRPIWSILDRSQTPHPRFKDGDTLAGGVSIYNLENDYIDMCPRRESPPPVRLVDQDEIYSVIL